LTADGGFGWTTGYFEKAYKGEYARTDRLTYSNGDVSSFDYDYDRAGRLSRATFSGTTGGATPTPTNGSAVYTYDPDGGLAKVVVTGTGLTGVASIDCARSGNDLRPACNTPPDANGAGTPLVAAGDWDVSGRLTKWQGMSLSYDARGRLAKATRSSDSLEARYYYDAAGMRILKTVSDPAKSVYAATRYVYAGTNLVAERTINYTGVDLQTPRARTERRYVWLGLRPVGFAVKASSWNPPLETEPDWNAVKWRTYDILADRIGRPVELVDSRRVQTDACKDTPDEQCCMTSDDERWSGPCDEICSAPPNPDPNVPSPCPAWCANSENNPAWPGAGCEPHYATKRASIWLAKYEPYGKVIEERCRAIAADPTGGAGGEGAWSDCASSLTIDLRAPGQYHDRETGWYYNGQRYYIPELYRYNVTL